MVSEPPVSIWLSLVRAALKNKKYRRQIKMSSPREPRDLEVAHCLALGRPDVGVGRWKVGVRALERRAKSVPYSNLEPFGREERKPVRKRQASDFQSGLGRW